MGNTFEKLSDFGPTFQSKVIAALITDNSFLGDVCDNINIGDFSNKAHKRIIEAILEYYSKYNIYPTIEVLATEVKKTDNEALKAQLKTELEAVVRHAKEAVDLDYVKDNYFMFCRNQQMKNAILTSAELLTNGGNFDDIFELISKAVKSGVQKDPGLRYNTDIEARYRAEMRKPIPFPWNEFNTLTQGGYGEGDLVLIFGSPGGGKSWVVCAMGAYALMSGYNVVHYTLELGDIYTSKRYDSILTGIDSKDLPENREIVEDTMSKLKGKLVIKEYAPKRASFATIKSHLRQLQTIDGFTPDLIIIDYLDYLKPSSSKKDRKDEIDDVFIEAKSTAKELRIPIISPSQANRTGAKSDILEGDNAAGSYDKIMIADIIISLARNKDDKVNGTGRFHFIKNRYGGDGLTFNATVNTNNGNISIGDNFEQTIQNSSVMSYLESFGKPDTGDAGKFFGMS